MDKQSEYTLIFAVACGLVICFLLWKLAHQNNVIGRMIRWVWNISFKIASIIPFCGWMAHFIIADTQQEKANKREYQEAGRRVDQAAYDRLGEKAHRELEE